MSELALRRIAENKAKHARGEDARTLNLRNCRLTELPAEVGEMHWLEIVRLGNTRPIPENIIFSIYEYLALRQVHDKIERKGLILDLLKSMDNRLVRMIDKYLINLNINWIEHFPKILYKLPNLKCIDFNNSLLNTIDNDILMLKGLKAYDDLRLRYKHEKNTAVKNQDYEVAANLRDQETKVGLHINHEHFISPPPEIAEQGLSAILRYFEDLEKEGEDQIYEAKLLLIGEGGAGKTTLCRKLFDPDAELPREEERTKGIDIHPLYFDLPDKAGKQFRLNIWDFAGQGKYQSAHSFFYTHRSLYVLVDDTRTLNENDAYRALYNNWLQTAELFGGQSPVLVLHNEKAGCIRTGFSLGGLTERFPFVHGELFRINLGGREHTKIIDLRRQIERCALALPHIGDTVPKTWVKVREAIEKERQAHPYISAERYRQLCVESGIEDPQRQSDLSQYFHDLGVFLHFQDNPLLKRDVFLQNQWVTDAVYKILDDRQIAEEQRGRFYPADLVRLWSEGDYRERRDELLALMLQFELCYRVQDSDTYICPQLLPGDVPTYELGEGHALQLKYEYVFMPKGLLYRLIVRLHRLIAEGQTAVWNSGVLLERPGARAEITESLDRRTISVRATGARAKELVTIIDAEMEKLHAPFGERLRVEVKIPCICGICKGGVQPHFYDKTDLDTRTMKGRETVECRVSYEDVPVRALLDGVFGKASLEPKYWFEVGEIEEGLRALLPDNKARLLLTQFKDTKRKLAMGVIDYAEFERIQNRILAAAMELL